MKSATGAVSGPFPSIIGRIGPLWHSIAAVEASADAATLPAAMLRDETILQQDKTAATAVIRAFCGKP